MANSNDRAGDDRERMSSPSPEADSLSTDHLVDPSAPGEGEPAPAEPEAPSLDALLAVEVDENARMSSPRSEAFAEGELVAPLTTTASLADGPAVIVRYGQMRHIGACRHNFKTPPRPRQKVVVRTDRGVELGEVVSCVCGGGCGFGTISSEELNTFVKDNGPEYPFHRDGKIMRLANSQDIIDDRHLRNSAAEERAFCRQLIKQMNLPMRIVTVDHLLGGERIIFYFTSEARVDFRDLVRELAGQYHTRIEMRQVGARDEARLVADYEKCGQQCCCQSYLKDLRPVSMRMAKTQKASLDPTKISGRCGRLMCCLRYEDAGYEELKKRLPRKNSWVRTAKQFGRVVDGQILTQLVMIELLDRTQVAVPNEEIVERNCTPPSPDQLMTHTPREREDRGPRVRLADQAAKQAAERAAERAQADLAAAAAASQENSDRVTEPETPDENPSPVPTAEEIPLADVAYYETTIEGGSDEGGSDEQGAEDESPARDEPVEVGGGQGERGAGDSSRRRRRRRKGRSGGQGSGQGGGQSSGQPQQQRPPQQQQRQEGRPQGDQPPRQGGHDGQDAGGKRRRRRRRGGRGGGGGGGAPQGGGGAPPAPSAG